MMRKNNCKIQNSNYRRDIARILSFPFTVRFWREKIEKSRIKMMRRLKTPIFLLQANFTILYNILHFGIFFANLIYIKKFDMARRAYKYPMPWVWRQ
jgi:hypothetical protein